MFVFGHLGIGSKLAAPWSHGLLRRALFLGTILPDLIDKPIYYGLVLATGRRGAELGILRGTRLFGHTALFLAALSLLATVRRSRWLTALALGVATHLLLDNFADAWSGPSGTDLVAFIWPLRGMNFPTLPFHSVHEHLESISQPLILGGEIVGAAILAWDYFRLKTGAA